MDKFFWEASVELEFILDINVHLILQKIKFNLYFFSVWIF